MAKITELKERDTQETLFPVTHQNCIITDDGTGIVTNKDLLDFSNKIAKGSYTINFGTQSTLAEDFNLEGNIEITEVKMENVAKCKVNTFNVGDGKGLQLKVEDGEKLVWEIERITDNATATIAVKYKINI